MTINIKQLTEYDEIDKIIEELKNEVLLEEAKENNTSELKCCPICGGDTAILESTNYLLRKALTDITIELGRKTLLKQKDIFSLHSIIFKAFYAIDSLSRAEADKALKKARGEVK
jgi:hypothetical protein